LAILVSALVSLTLIPMLCARFLSAENVPVDESQHAYGDAPAHAPRPQKQSFGLRSTQWFENLFEYTLHRYARGLDWCLAHRK
ncbi:efflux RND transporter permease subunit, partial [Acinetobacter baumannii]